MTEFPNPTQIVDTAPSALDDAHALEGTGLDRLTRLIRRPALHRALVSALAARAGDGPQPALLVLDLDRFQSINDSTGITTGDGVLSRVARRIGSAVPRAATVARISGNEFAVLLPDGSEAAAIAARLLELIGRSYAVNGHAVTLSVSIGLALARAPQHGEDADALLRAALALNKLDLRKTMAVEQFEVHYQPQVTVSGQRLFGFEALARWRRGGSKWRSLKAP